MAAPAFNTSRLVLAGRSDVSSRIARDSIRAEHLSGNVGVLTLGDGRLDSAAIVAAMWHLNATDALIIDLRYSGHLDPAIAALVASWLFDTAPALGGESYVEPGTPLSVEPSDDPARYLDKPVMVALGSASGIVAAELARNLKRLRRAIIVGESPRDVYVAANVPAPATRALKVAHLVTLSSLQLRRSSGATQLALQAAIVGVRRDLEQLRSRDSRRRVAS